MSEHQTGLLLTISRWPAELIDRSDLWQQQFARATAELAGVVGARQLIAADRSGVRPAIADGVVSWLSSYDVEVAALPDVLADVRRRDRDCSAELLGAASGRQHRSYLPVPVPAAARAGEPADAAVAISCVWWTPRPGTESDFHAWYDQEHIPLVMQVPGRIRLRRFVLADGSGPRFLAVHDFDRAIAATTANPAAVAAKTSAWRERVVSDRIDYDSTRFAVRTVL